MKGMLRVPNLLLMAAALMIAAVSPAQTSRSTAGSKDKLVTVMNPAIIEKLAPRVPLAPRKGSLEGKTLYIVDMNYEGILGTPVLGEMQAWFARNMPGVKTVLKLKSGSYISDDPALWKEIAANNAGGVIIGVAG